MSITLDSARMPRLADKHREEAEAKVKAEKKAEVKKVEKKVVAKKK